MIFHVAINAVALRGPRTFDHAVGWIDTSVPALALFQWLFVYVPLGIHGALGLWLVTTHKRLERPYGPALGVAMRVTGVVALVFVATHVVDLHAGATGPRLGAGEIATLLDASMSTVWLGVPWRGLWYLVGSGATVVHFVAGLWAALSAGRAKESVMLRWVLAGLGFAMWLIVADVVVLRATGAAVVGDPASDRALMQPCPIPSK